MKPHWSEKQMPSKQKAKRLQLSGSVTGREKVRAKVQKSAKLKNLQNRKNVCQVRRLASEIPSASHLSVSLPQAQRTGTTWLANFGKNNRNNSVTHSTATRVNHQSWNPQQYIDRSQQRNMSSCDQAYDPDYYQTDSFRNIGQHDFYIDFNPKWPDPWESQGSHSRNHYQRQKGQQNWHIDSRNSSGDRLHWSNPNDFNNHPMSTATECSWQNPGHSSTHEWPGKEHSSKLQPAESCKNKPKAQSQWDSGQSTCSSEKNVTNSSNRWGQFTKQFGYKHFHRDEWNRAEDNFDSNSGTLGAVQADSSCLDASGCCAGKKRTLPLDRERQLSKSSRASDSKGRSFLDSSGFQDLPSSDATGEKFPKPDSTSKHKIVHSGEQEWQKVASVKSIAQPLAKVTETSGKKKHILSKHISASRALPENGMTELDKQGAETSEEGVLERAERVCRELREKRQQAGCNRATLSGQKIAALRSALNSTVHRFNSAHKSFIRGYLSDSSPPIDTSVSGSNPISSAQKKHFSSSVSSSESLYEKGLIDNELRTRSKSATTSNAPPAKQVNSTTSSFVSSSSSSLRDVDCMQQPVKNNAKIDGSERGLTGKEPGSLNGPEEALFISSPTQASAAGKKPPLPLSRDALTKMVNAPNSRTQRVQLARMLRQHTTTAVIRPKQIQLDGLYDSMNNEGDTIGDVLKNISGLKEIEDCPELKNIKLEDLTNEDKMRIAQLIEEADFTDRENQQVTFEMEVRLTAKEQDLPSSSDTNCVEALSRKDKTTDLSEPKSPGGPLSIGDLNAMPFVNSSSPLRSALNISSPISEPFHFLPPLTSMPLRSESSLTSVAIAAATCSDSNRTSVNLSTDPDTVDGMSEHFVDQLSSDCKPQADAEMNSPVVPPLQSPADQACDQPESSKYSVTGQMLDKACDIPESCNCSVTGGGRSAQEAKLMREVVSVCQQQDSDLAEMHTIDLELSQMYKSLIDIVARMSSLQRRRVQLQSQGEKFSQRRNHLLSELVPNTDVALNGQLNFMTARTQLCTTSSAFSQNTLVSSATSDKAQKTGSTVNHCSDNDSAALTSRVTSPFSSGHQVMEKNEHMRRHTESIHVPSGVNTSSVCLTPLTSDSALNQLQPSGVFQKSSVKNQVDNVKETGEFLTSISCGSDLHLQAKALTTGRDAAWNAQNDIVERGNRDVTRSSVSLTLTEASLCGEKQSVGVDSSSGSGSGISKLSGSRQVNSIPVSDQCVTDDSTSVVSGKSCDIDRKQEAESAQQPALGSHHLLSSLGFSQVASISGSHNCTAESPNTPGVSFAYIGSLSSNLVQQIVRNLPLTSQVGEVNMLKSQNPMSENTSGNASVFTTSISADTPAEKCLMRSDVLHRLRTSSLPSDMSSGEQTQLTSVPQPKQSVQSGRETFRTCTSSHSESEAHSVTSGTSLGEQIKLFSQRNSSQGTSSGQSSLPVSAIIVEEKNADITVEEMADCTAVLEKPGNNKWDFISQPHKKDDENDRPKKRKTKKDRDQSLRRRRHYMVDSSSEEESEVSRMGSDDFPDVARSPKQCAPLPGGVELMEADEGELDSTLVASEQQHLSQETFSDEEDTGSKAAISLAINPRQLRLNPDDLKAFRANFQRNLLPSVAKESSPEGPANNCIDSAVTKKDQLKISGPCMPVMGIHVHSNSLYVGFQSTGVNSYTMEGLLTAEYCVQTAHCFTVVPHSPGYRPIVAIGGEHHLAFYSTRNQSIVNDLDCMGKVICLLVVDSLLFAGLDSGTVIVINLMKLQETRHFQASDCAVHCMTWTREGSTRLLCIASQDAKIHIVDAASGLPIRIIRGHTKTAFSLCILEHTLLSGSGDKKVMAHNVHTAALEWELQDQKGIISSICIYNGLLFTAGYDKNIRCYDLKSHKLLHLMYGAGKSIIMKMTVHNSILYTGNRDGQVEGVNLEDLGSFTCQCVSCCTVYGLKEHLWHHLVTDHLLPNAQAMRCPWSNCPTFLNTGFSMVEAREHMRNHVEGS